MEISDNAVTRDSAEEVIALAADKMTEIKADYCSVGKMNVCMSNAATTTWSNGATTAVVQRILLLYTFASTQYNNNGKVVKYT